RAILDGGVGPDSKNSWGTPLIFTAACNDSTDCLRLLVDRKANLDAPDGELGETAMFEAFSKLCYDQVEFLIQKGAKVDITLINGVTLAYSLQRRLEQAKPGTPAHQKLTEIKEMMQNRGIAFPAESPPTVRGRLKAQ